ncbi:GNAT family N-acetyltransferase [Glutamicibacter sp. JC586]|uniref:GNAT family N-acetyltransferase n=1 Tax=Glutamicibacter sp. JC586 TaxID=2590552 RepID=UPI00135A160A|nr:GNAT family N-acetyltransferase [Glutamicibacter sp. JC586]
MNETAKLHAQTRTYQATERTEQNDAAIKLFHQATGIGFYEQFPAEEKFAEVLTLTYAQRMRVSMVFDLAAPSASRHAAHPVHTYGTFPGSLNAGGNSLVPVHKITAVTVAPSYRRRGLLTEQITADLHYAQEARYPLAALSASEATIYGRYGFEPATYQTRFKLKCAQGLKLRVKIPGQVVEIDPALFEEEFADLADRAMKATFGSIDSSAFDDGYALGRWDSWETMDKPKNLRFAAYYDAGGTLGGFVTYKFAGWDEPTEKLVVHKLIATSDSARFKLFEYLGNHDLIKEVHGQGPLADPLRQVLANARDYEVRSVDDALWLRVLNVVDAFQARQYLRNAKVVLSIRDRLNLISGDYLFEVSDGSAHIAQISSDSNLPDLPQVSLDERDLAGLYLGTLSLQQLLASGRAELAGTETSAEVLQMFDVVNEAFTPHSF